MSDTIICDECDRNGMPCLHEEHNASHPLLKAGRGIQDSEAETTETKLRLLEATFESREEALRERLNQLAQLLYNQSSSMNERLTTLEQNFENRLTSLETLILSKLVIRP